MEFVHRALFSVKKGGAGRGARWYKVKMEERREMGEGRYAVGASGLRMSSSVREGVLKVRMSRNLAVPKSLGMKMMRSRSFVVLKVPEGLKIPEEVRWEVVDEWEENILEEVVEEQEDVGEKVAKDQEDFWLPGFDDEEDEQFGVSGMRTGWDEQAAFEDEENSAAMEDTDCMTASGAVRPPPGIPRPTTSLEELDALLKDFILGRARQNSSSGTSAILAQDEVAQDEATPLSNSNLSSAPETTPAQTTDEDNTAQTWFQGLQI